MSEIGEVFGAMNDLRKARREAFGVLCPQCKAKRPKAHPSILLPQQRCKVDGYRDPRPYMTDEEEAAGLAKFGITLIPAKPQE